MTKMTKTAMRSTNGGGYGIPLHTVNGRFSKYHCAACYMQAFGTGIAWLFGWR